MSSPVRTCPRCGIRRQVKDGRGELCRDCWLVEPRWPAVQSVPNSVDAFA